MRTLVVGLGLAAACGNGPVASRVDAGAAPDAPARPDATATPDGATLPDAPAADAGLVESAWSPIGPAPIGVGTATTGRVTGVALASATTWYIATAGGGIWKTDDGGASWLPLTDAQPTLAGSAILVDPADAKKVWAGTGEANCSIDAQGGVGLLRTTDGGVGWSRTGASLIGAAPVARIALDPTTPAGNRTLYAAVARCYGIDRLRGMAQTGGLLQSTDDGKSWAFVGSPLFAAGTSAEDVVIAPDGAIYAARWALPPEDASQTGIYVSAAGDGGAHFGKLTTGLPADWTTVGRIALAIAPSNSQVLYAVLAGGIGQSFGNLLGVYRSADGGASWAPTTLATTERQYFYDIFVAVEPDDPMIVYVGGVGLHKSIDGGASWTLAPAAQDQHALGFVPGDQTRYVVGDDAGLFELGTTDLIRVNGVAPKALAITQGYAGAAHPTDPGIFYMGTQDNGIVKYTGDPSWTRLLAGDGGQMAVAPDDPNTVYECTEGYLERSDDAGATWNVKLESKTEGAEFVCPVLLDPGSASTVYLAASRVWKSTNRGDDWTPLMTEGLGLGLSALAVAPGGDVIYTGDAGGTVWSTFDGGMTWSPPQRAAAGLPGGANFTDGRVVSALAVDPGQPLVAYATYSGYDGFTAIPGHLFRTLDGGTSWTRIDGPWGDEPLNWVLIDPQNPALVYIAADNGVFKSGNRGATWAPLDQGLPNAQVLQLVLNHAGTALFAVTHGRSVYRAMRTQP
jgi:photosystem II stability/assembly factor-like uncharacterized protein